VPLGNESGDTTCERDVAVKAKMLVCNQFVRLFASSAAMLSALACMEFADAAIISETPSISTSFAAFWTAAHNRPFADQQAIWDEVVEQPRQDVYASVVWEVRDNPHWKEEKERLLRRRFLEYPRIRGQIPEVARTLELDVSVQAARFRALFPDAPARPSIQLVLAPSFDAKSGVLGNRTPVLVLAVDSLILEGADMSVIFPHELFHLYHANHAGIQNDGVMPGADLTLPLFAEGLATYVSSVLGPGHSDGQLLLQKNLGAMPVARLAEVAARFLSDADEKAIDPEYPATFRRWFKGSNENYQPDLPNRTGYWLGLHVIRQIRRQYSLREMASWSPSMAQTQTRAALLEMSSLASIAASASRDRITEINLWGSLPGLR
jgi:hypothetical protein